MINRRKGYRVFLLMFLLLYCISFSACSVGHAADRKTSSENKQSSTVKKDSDNNQDNNQVSAVKSTSDENSKNNSANSSTTASTTESNEKNGIVIVIDPGHGSKADLSKEPIAPGSSEMKIKDGGGATGVATGTPEYVINRKVALKLETLLKSKGFTVIMTKTEDSEDPGNVDRAETGNKNNAKLVIRIHADSCDNGSVSGATMLVPGTAYSNTKSIYTESRRCGEIILNTLTKEVGMKNRGISERNDLTGFNWSTVPVILIEMGFLSNPDEDKLLCDDKYEDKMAAALSDGVVQALEKH